MTTCRLRDGEACITAADCATGYCRAYYRDDDRDGYGVESPDTIDRCDATPRAPQGFAATAGDCCDTDSGATPALPVSTYSATKDACGSFDWNCDGVEQKLSAAACPTGGEPRSRAGNRA